jgi:hypothetical protein
LVKHQSLEHPPIQTHLHHAQYDVDQKPCVNSDYAYNSNCDLQYCEMITMPAVTVPDFATLLADHIGSVPEEATPAFLARLERTAAERYRIWAQEIPEHAEGLLRCAAREDDIADRVEQIFPTTAPELVAAMDSAIGPARDTYYEVFSGLTPVEQMVIQANAERQGAAAWRAMIDQQSDEVIRAALEQCAQIEEVSADYLDALLAELAPG